MATEAYYASLQLPPDKLHGPGGIYQKGIPCAFQVAEEDQESVAKIVEAAVLHEVRRLEKQTQRQLEAKDKQCEARRCETAPYSPAPDVISVQRKILLYF
jgi:hypothetical protein